MLPDRQPNPGYSEYKSNDFKVAQLLNFMQGYKRHLHYKNAGFQSGNEVIFNRVYKLYFMEK